MTFQFVKTFLEVKFGGRWDFIKSGHR
jgi:hypothetical protein